MDLAVPCEYCLGFCGIISSKKFKAILYYWSIFDLVLNSLKIRPNVQFTKFIKNHFTILLAGYTFFTRALTREWTIHKKRRKSWQVLLWKFDVCKFFIIFLVSISVEWRHCSIKTMWLFVENCSATSFSAVFLFVVCFYFLWNYIILQILRICLI